MEDISFQMTVMSINAGFGLAIKIKVKVTWTKLEITKVVGEENSPKHCPSKAIEKDLVLSVSLKYSTHQGKDLIYSTCSTL